MRKNIEKLKCFSKKWLMLFILIQPFLDTYFLYQPPITTFFKFSPSTIIRIIFVIIIGISFILSQRNKKMNYFILGYSSLILIFFISHHLNALNFHSLVPGNFGYSLFGELFYIIRMSIPLIILLMSYKTSFSIKKIELIVSILVGLISGSIVLSNFLNFGLASYGDGGSWMTGSIFTWFSNSLNGTYSYYGLASKGFFYFANAISAVELLLAPMMFYFVLTNFNFKNIILIICQFLAMFMLGTKVAGLGFIGILFAILCMYLFFTFIKKEFHFEFKKFTLLIVLVIFSVGLFPFSPMENRANSDNFTQEQRDGDKSKVKKRVKELERERKKDSANNKPLVKYIKKNYPKYSINDIFIEDSYPYEYDPDFWYDIMKLPYEKRVNYRFLEKAMLDRVKEINHNKLDNWLGIGYTRMNNIFNLEQDFVSQYYVIGILGVLIFIMPHVAILLYAIYRVLRYYKELFTFRNTCFILGVFCIIAISLYSGNVMDFLTDTIILAFFEGQILNFIAKKRT